MSKTSWMILATAGAVVAIGALFVVFSRRGQPLSTIGTGGASGGGANATATPTAAQQGAAIGASGGALVAGIIDLATRNQNATDNAADAAVNS